MEKTVDVIIPVYKPDERFRRLLLRLSRQSYPIQRIILMNTEEQYWKEEYRAGCSNVEVHHLPKARFDHGGTRMEAANLSDADYMVFMTQDAMPCDFRLIEHLVEGISQKGVKAAYGRQLPAEDCKILEQYTRSFNYPEYSFVKSLRDLKRLGIKTYFCSDVCAIYEKETFLKLGGFVTKAIFNEDMIYVAGLIQAGYSVAYVADACVIHSHNYNCRQQFHRNFDLGVSQKEHPEVFAQVPSEGEGVRLVKATAKYACKIHRPWLVVGLFFQSAAKYMGYFLGKRYNHLPKRLVLKLSMNPDYFR